MSRIHWQLGSSSSHLDGGESPIEEDEFTDDLTQKHTVILPDKMHVGPLISDINDDDQRHSVPRKLLIELFDLELKDGGEWLESARWIKYEEHSEGVDHHWGQPHVAFLSFHSLTQLHKCMTKGVVLLDLDCGSFPQVCTRIAEAMKNNGLEEKNTKLVIDLLSMKHTHLHRHRLTRMKTSANLEHRNIDIDEHFEMQKLNHEESATTFCNAFMHTPRLQRSVPASLHSHNKVSSVMQFIFNAAAKTSNGELHSSRPDEIVSQLPEGAETAQVFVGAIAELTRARFVMVRLKEAVYMAELMEAHIPVRFLFLIIGPELDDIDYHELGRAIATLMSNKRFRQLAYDVRDRNILIKAIDEFLDESVVIPPGDVDSNRLLSGDEIKKALRRRRKSIPTDLSQPCQPSTNGRPSSLSFGPSRSPSFLQRRGRLFAGVCHDFSSRYPFYWSDFHDAFNIQCVSSVVFMFFACFAPAITFGGLLSTYTNEKLGTVETLVSQCICGVIWGIFAAQPLLVASATGPVFIFEASLYEFCIILDVDFLTFRMYAGLWLLLIATLSVALEASSLLVYVTRFTEDIFATLISLIFIAETVIFIITTFNANPVSTLPVYHDNYAFCINSTNSNDCTSRNQPNTGLVTVILVLSTFCLAYGFKRLRQSFYLGRHLRRTIGDLGILIAIIIVAILAHYIFPHTFLQRLEMPSTFGFTNSHRRGHSVFVAWYLPPDKMWQTICLALLPALLVYILFFAETEITELLLSKKERGLRKGSGGFHWDLLLTGLLAFICGLLGLPWMCVAAVQSLAHCASLSVVRRHAPGERPVVDYVIEQRVTTIAVALLIGLFALAGNYLKLPLAILFGVFLYLGLMNLSGVQMIQRTILLLIPEKYFPDHDYCQKVSMWRMHLYTFIQIVCLLAIYAVKLFKKSALAFPFVLIVFILIRQFILPRIFHDTELKALDENDESNSEDWFNKDLYDCTPIPV